MQIRPVTFSARPPGVSTSQRSPWGGGRFLGLTMSTQAPWLALSVDWQDSDMFVGATAEEQLAWICLLCHAKTHGRAGVVRAKPGVLLKRWGITEAALVSMLERARVDKAVTIDTNWMITIVNWKTYQDPRHRGARAQTRAPQGITGEEGQSRGFTETPVKDATPHTSPRTPHPLPLRENPKEDSLSETETDHSPDHAEKVENRTTAGWMKEKNFQTEWARWQTHRKEIGKTLKPTTRQAQLKLLEKLGHDRAIATIRHTIDMGWTGLREPDAPRTGSGQHQDSPARVRAKPGKYDNFRYTTVEDCKKDG